MFIFNTCVDNCVSVCVSVYVCVSVCVCVHVSVYLGLYIWICVCVYCLYLCVCACVEHIHMYEVYTEACTHVYGDQRSLQIFFFSVAVHLISETFLTLGPKAHHSV